MVRLPASLLHEITKVIQHAKGVSATKPVSTEARFRLRMVKLLCLAKQAESYAVMSCRRGALSLFFACMFLLSQSVHSCWDFLFHPKYSPRLHQIYSLHSFGCRNFCFHPLCITMMCEETVKNVVEFLLV